MSNPKTTSTSTTLPATAATDAEMLKNLDLLMNYDLMNSNLDLQLLEDLDDLEESPALQKEDDEQGDSK